MNLKLNLLKAGSLLLLLSSSSSVSAVDVDKACPDGYCPGLGESFYLPQVNVVDTNTNGKTILKTEPILSRARGDGGCANMSTPFAQGNDKFDFTSGMQNVVQKLATSSNVTGDVKTNIFSMSTSAQLQTGFSSDITTSFNQVVYDRSVTEGVVDLNNNAECLSVPLIRDDVINSFKSLPLELANQEGGYSDNDSAWNAYRVFLVENGSHMVVKMRYGSRFQIWESTQSNESDIQSTLNAKVCLSAEYQGGTSAAISGCSGISEESRNKAKNTSTNTQKVIRGGTFQARANLTNSTTVENMANFISSSQGSDQPIDWSYKPIWEIFQSYYLTECLKSGSSSDACNNYQRALNLEAAYSGYLAWGCSYNKSKNNYVMGGLKKSSTDVNGTYTWSCAQSRTGCRTNDDCWAGGAGTVTYCYGPSCFDQQDIQSAPDKKLTIVRGDKRGSYYEGVNNSCYYKAFRGGTCDTSWSGGLPDRTIWNQTTRTKSVINNAAATTQTDDVSVFGTKTYEIKVKVDSGHKPDGEYNNDQQDSDVESTKTAAYDRQYLITSSPEGITCPGDCTMRFQEGQHVTLIFGKQKGTAYQFKEWGGDACEKRSKKPTKEEAVAFSQTGLEATAKCEFVVDQDMTIEANIRAPRGNE